MLIAKCCLGNWPVYYLAAVELNLCLHLAVQNTGCHTYEAADQEVSCMHRCRERRLTQRKSRERRLWGLATTCSALSSSKRSRTSPTALQTRLSACSAHGSSWQRYTTPPACPQALLMRPQKACIRSLYPCLMNRPSVRALETLCTTMCVQHDFHFDKAAPERRDLETRFGNDMVC